LAFSWTDKPWFLTEGKLPAVLIIPSSWGSQLDDEITSTPCRINGQVGSLVPHQMEGGLSILQYVDDIILIMEHDLAKAVNMKLISAFVEQLSV
jgi:hypothetical protein